MKSTSAESGLHAEHGSDRRFAIKVAKNRMGTGPTQKSRENGKKTENGLRPEMTEQWPPKCKKMATKIPSWGPFRWPFFGPFGPGAIFHFLPFSGFLCRAGFPFCIWPRRWQAFPASILRILYPFSKRGHQKMQTNISCFSDFDPRYLFRILVMNRICRIIVDHKEMIIINVSGEHMLKNDVDCKEHVSW